jgi:peptidoglycan/LPS O-acetylase OafA/YrhL
MLMKTNADSGAKVETGWIPELDGLRAVACVMVVIAHFNPWLGGYVSPVLQPIKFFSPGNLGVMLFFSLSSFLLTSVCLSEMDRTGALDVRTFLIRRALRIWPLYFSIFAATAFFISPHSPFPMGPGASTTDDQWSWVIKAAPAYALFVGNWVQQRISEIGIFWTICVEEQFYFALPFILPLIVRMSRQYLIVLVSIIATAAAVVYFPNPVFFEISQGYYQTTTYISTFCFGAVAAIMFRRGAGRSLLEGWRVGGVAIAAALVVVALFPSFWWPPYGASAAILYNIVPALLMLIVYCIATNSGSSRLRFLRSEFVRSIGMLSYRIYLTHVLSHRFANLEVDLLHIGGVRPAAVYHVLFVQYFSFAVLLASIANGAIEGPFLKLRARLIPGKTSSAIDFKWHLQWKRFAIASGLVTAACLAALSLVRFI